MTVADRCASGAATSLRCVVVTGGGTAGHTVPTMPVIEHLVAGGCTVHFVGSTTGLEERLVAPLGVAYHGVSTGKLRRYFSLANFTDLVRIPLGVFQAWRLLGRIRPQVVFSKGGFVSFAASVAGWLRRVPVVAHESDLTPGLATRLTAPLVTALCVNFDETRAGVQRTVPTGTPIREALLRGDAGHGRALLGIDGDRPVMLVVGGSLGAVALNAVVREGLDELLARYTVVHVCGPGRVDEALRGRAGYIQREYIDDGWGDAIAASDFVVSRAGANALHEWLALGKPHLLVPLPRSVSRGDQVENAEYARRRGLSLVVAQEELTPAALLEGAARLAGSLPQWRRKLAGFAARDSVALIVAELERAAGSARSGVSRRHV